MKYHRRGGLNNRNSFFHSPGGWKSETEVSDSSEDGIRALGKGNTSFILTVQKCRTVESSLPASVFSEEQEAKSPSEKGGTVGLTASRGHLGTRRAPYSCLRLHTLVTDAMGALNTDDFG